MGKAEVGGGVGGECAALARVAAAAARREPLDAVLAMAVAEAAAMLDADLVVAWRAEGPWSAVAATSSPDLATPGARMPLLGEGAVAGAQRVRRPVRVEYARLPAGDPAESRARVRGMAVGAAVPIATGGRVWGALHAASRRADGLPDDDLERLRAAGEVVALAVTAAEDRELLRRRVEEGEAVGRVASLVAHGASRDEVLAAAAREVAVLLGLETGAVGRFTEGRCERVTAWVAPGVELRLDEAPTAIPVDSDTIVGRVWRTGRAARIDDYRDLVDPVAKEVRRMVILSSVAAPVTVDGELWGLISAGSPRPGAIAADAEERISRFAELVGLAVSRARGREDSASGPTADPVTGLADRAAFVERLADALRRHPGACALALLDIDDLAGVNGRHGHGVGDRVLAEVARRLAAQARPGDLVARVGGEEFGWLMPGADETAAIRAAERGRSAVSAVAIGTAGIVTVSAGVAPSADGDGPDALLARAGAALGAAKAVGGDACVRHSDVPGAGA